MQTSGPFILPALGIPLRTIYCIGRNFAEHAKELGNPRPTEPVVFLKPQSAACVSGSEIVIPSVSSRVDHEVEIVVAIAMPGKGIPVERALDFVAGYGVGIDFTARDIQEAAKKKSLPWTVAKGFDTFAPMSAFVRPGDLGNPGDVSSLSVNLQVNGELRQKGNAGEMLFSIPELISYLSGVFTLYPGDVIFTGTPAGVSPVKAGDVLQASLSVGIGELCARLEVTVR